MWPQSTLILVSCILAFALPGCGKGKSYPTAPAPPTIKDPPPKPMKSAMRDDDGDDDTGDPDDDEPRRPSRRRVLSNLSTGGVAPRIPPPMSQAASTINGHPQGPKAEVFNAVTNNAYSRAAPCFAAQGGGGTTVASVRMTVANSGAVAEVEVTAGPKAEAFRKCLQGVVKGLTYPAFKGPKVTKTINFTAVTGAQ
ncbi:MAG: hypothetical protein ABI333_01245 [bacterium]